MTTIFKLQQKLCKENRKGQQQALGKFGDKEKLNVFSSVRRDISSPWLQFSCCSKTSVVTAKMQQPMQWKSGDKSKHIGTAAATVAGAMIAALDRSTNVAVK